MGLNLLSSAVNRNESLAINNLKQTASTGQSKPAKREQTIQKVLLPLILFTKRPIKIYTSG
jgi:hypothetical protein